MSVKIGCAVWTLMEPNYKAPYENAIRKVAKAGFEGIELMVNDAQEMEDYWTDSKVEEIRELLADLKLELTQLCVFQNMVGGLVDLDKTISQNALNVLESVFVLAKKFRIEKRKIIISKKGLFFKKEKRILFMKNSFQYLC